MLGVDARRLEQVGDPRLPLVLPAAGDDEDEAVEELVEREVVGEALPRGGDRLDDARGVELAHHHRLDEGVRLLHLVRLDAADEVRLRVAERRDERRERLAEVVDHADELRRLEPLARLLLLLEDVGDELVVGELHEHLEVLRERVLVLHQEPLRLVGHLPRVVRDREGVLVLAVLREARVLLVRLLDLEEPRGVGGVGEEALLAEEGEQPVRRRLDQRDHLRVVFERHPADVDPLARVPGGAQPVQMG